MNRTRFRTAAALATGALLLAPLAACGGDDDKKPAASATSMRPRMASKAGSASFRRRCGFRSARRATSSDRIMPADCTLEVLPQPGSYAVPCQNSSSVAAVLLSCFLRPTDGARRAQDPHLVTRP